MNMEEMREIVRELFKKHGQNTSGYPELSKTILKEVSNGHWDFDEYYKLIKNISGKMSNERRTFLILHSQFLIAYNEYILGVVPDESTSNVVYHFMKKRQKSMDRLNRLTSCEIQAQVTV